MQPVSSEALSNMTIQELLGMTLSTLARSEQTAYLKRDVLDKGNGCYERSLQIGSVPVTLQVPRTRKGDFRPTLLPMPYQRGYPDSTQQLLLGLLASSRSINAAMAALRKMGLSVPDQDLETIAAECIEELDLLNSKPIDPDLLALFLDAKYVEVKEGDRIRPSCIYVVVGLGCDGKKRVLASVPRTGRENVEDWKKILRGVLERGLRRVMIVIQDDFSGLLPITKGLFPQSDIQLCIVHMQRNAKTHLGKTEAVEFTQRIRAIKACWDMGLAAKQFDDLCEHFAQDAPTFIAEIKKKRDHYLYFLKYPEGIRRTLSTTNAVEAVNGQLEIMRRNNGGYFQSESILKLKLSLAVTSLAEGTWKKPAASVRAALHQFVALFQARFETNE